MNAKVYKFHLYVVGQDVASSRSLLDKVRETLTHAFGDSYCLEVRDIFEPDNAMKAIEDQVFSVPSLVRLAPEPMRMIVGAFDDLAEMVKQLR